MTEQPEKQQWNRVVPVEYEPLTRKVELKVSTIAFGVFIGNVLTGIVGTIFSPSPPANRDAPATQPGPGAHC